MPDNRVRREDLLAALAAVQPGLAPREIVEQSTCFILKDGEVLTFNDEVACRAPALWAGDFVGAIPSKPLLEMLGKLPDEELEVKFTDSELVLKGKGRSSGIRVEAEVLLPVDQVERPGKWRRLPPEFAQAVALVHECASTDATQYVISSIHISPSFVEACDNFQLCRFTLETGFKKDVLVRHDSLKPVGTLGAVAFSLTDNWVHFKNAAGAILSCRPYLEEFPDFGAFLSVDGERAALPKGLAEAADRCSVFSGENPDADRVKVELRAGKLRLSGEGASGWHREVKQTTYKGRDLSFLVSPKLLAEITKKATECVVSQDRLLVDGGSWTYVACLHQEERAEEANGEANGEPEPAPRRRKRAAVAEEGGEE